MAQTPIPRELIRDPREAERDANRFDHLCELVEEIALPVVESALRRETVEAGAEVLTEEARIALQVLAEDADLLEELDEKDVLQQVQKSLSDESPLPDEEEIRQHARDFSQVLTSAWLETLRRAESRTQIVILSDYLVPHMPSHTPAWPMEQFVATVGPLPQKLVEATGWFALNEREVADVLRTLRAKLFAEPQLIDLPFNLILAGTPRESAIALSRRSLERLRAAMQRFTEDEKARVSEFDPGEEHYEPVTIERFDTPHAQVAFESLSEPLPVAQYACLAMVAVPEWGEESIEARVQDLLRD